MLLVLPVTVRLHRWALSVEHQVNSPLRHVPVSLLQSPIIQVEEKWAGKE